MHLAINAVGVKYGGGATVLTSLLAAARRNTRFNRVSVFSAPLRQVELARSSLVQFIEHENEEVSQLRRFAWQTLHLRNELRSLSADVMLAFTGVGSSGRIPQVTFVQNSLPFLTEALDSCTVRLQLKMHFLARLMERACARSRLVIVQTSTMRETLIRAFGLAPQSVRVFFPDVSRGQGCTPSFLPAEIAATPAHCRLLYVGHDAPYKNLAVMTSAFSAARRWCPHLTLVLTVAPDHNLCRTKGVHGLGYLNGSQLSALYDWATILINPSLGETIGFSLVESMAHGLAVLSADRPYAREVCGEAALYFDPLNPADLAAGIMLLVSDAGQRAALGGRGLEISRQRAQERPYDMMVDAIADAALSRS